MTERSVNVADAKKHLSELLGCVAYGGEHIVITKRGKPMARLVPAEEDVKHLADARGWLDEGDPFFDTIELIIRKRLAHIPRIVVAGAEDEIPA
jgi:prevent-host-death family protein